MSNNIATISLLLLRDDVPDVCFLTDMSVDIDDLGALQLACYYHKAGYINLRAVIAGTSRSKNHRVIKQFLNYWGMDDVRIGTNKHGNGVSFENDGRWVNSYLNAYPTPDFVPENGASLLNKMLDQYPNCIVIEVGPPTTVFNAQAIDRITQYVQMGGVYPSGGEFNLIKEPYASQYVSTGKHVDWYDKHLGMSICTGYATEFPHDTPVKTGYQIYNGGYCRWSWDLTAVVGAVEPEYFNFLIGHNHVNQYGSSDWSDGAGTHRMAFAKNTGVLRDRIVELIGKRPQDVR